MPRNRSAHPTEFRQQIIRLAHELECAALTIADFDVQAHADASQSLQGEYALTNVECQESIRLRWQLHHSLMERDTFGGLVSVICHQRKQSARTAFFGL